MGQNDHSNVSASLGPLGCDAKKRKKMGDVKERGWNVWNLQAEIYSIMSV